MNYRQQLMLIHGEDQTTGSTGNNKRQNAGDLEIIHDVVVGVWFLTSVCRREWTRGSREIVRAAENKVISGNCLIGRLL